MAMFWKICVVVTLALCSQVFAQRKKPDLLGGWRETNENDEYTMNALRYAKEEYNKNSKNGYITEITKIIRLRKQVVSGMKYSMEVEAVVSPCSENEFILHGCQDQNTIKKTCSFEVVVVPWRNYKELTNGHCNTIRN